MQTTSARRPRLAHFLEVLEARIAPATLVSYNATTHDLTVLGDYVDDGSSVVQAGASENLSFTIQGGNLLITDGSHHVTDTGAGTQVTANQVSVPLTALTGNITINTFTGADSLTFSNTLALTADHDFIATTTGTITLAAGAQYSVAGNGFVFLTTTRDIALLAGSSLSVADGDLHLTATGAVSGNYAGINLAGNVTSTGSGGLFFSGIGGSTGTGNHGISFSGSLTSTGSGQISLSGSGGEGTDNNNGLSLLSGTITGSTSEITLLGTAGGDGGTTVGIDLGITLSGASSNLIELHTDAGLKFEAGAVIDAGTHPVLLTPLTSATAIDLGTFQRTSFGVSSAMLAAVTAGAIEVGTSQSGAITVSAAVSSSHSLELHTAGGITGTGAITVTNNQDFLTASAGNVNLTGVLTVPGLATFQGTGVTDITLINSGNDFASVNIVSAHNASLRDDTGFTLSAEVNGLLTLNSAGTITQSGNIFDGANLLKTGFGTLHLTANTLANVPFTNITVSAGTLQFDSPFIASGTITLGDFNTGNVVSLLASAALAGASLDNPIVVPSLSGNPAVVIGSTAFTSANPVQFTGSLMLDRPATLQGGATGGTSFQGAISGNLGTLTIAGGHTVELAAGSANTFVGNVQVTAASTLQLGSGGDEIPDSANLDLAVNTLLVLAKDASHGESINNLTGTGTVTTRAGAASQSLTIGANNGGFVFNGPITQNSSSLSLIKSGTGVAELHGAMSYTGSTTVAGGFLELHSTASDNPLPNSSTIDVRAGATLDVTNLGGAADPGTLAVALRQTLRGSGTIIGDIAGTGTVLPGESTGVGILTINGAFNPTGHVTFRVNSPYTTAGADYDQIVVSDNVNLNGALVGLAGGAVAPLSGATVQVISNTSANTTVTGHSPAEGGVLFAGPSAFAITYAGGDNNDVVLTPAVGQVSFTPTLTAGKLTIANTGAGQSSQVSVFVSLGDLVITSALDLFSAAPAGGQLLSGNHGISIPVAKVTKGVVFNGGGGDDMLIVDLSTGSKLPASGVFFNGGAQSSAAGDQILITAGTQTEGDVTYNLTNAHDGSVVMSKFGKVTYTGLEPVKNTGDANNVTFNLPAGPNNANLAEDGIPFNGLTRLSGSTFEQTDFKSAGTLTINRGSASDSLTVGNLLDLAAFDVELGSVAKPFGNIVFVDNFFNESGLSLAATNLQVPAGIALSPAGDGTLTVGGGVVNGTIDGHLSLTKFGITDLFLNGANTFDGDTNLPSGPVDLGNALALQKSTVHIGSSFALQFGSGIGTFTLGGLAGSGALPLTDALGAAVTLKVGANDSIYSGVLSGTGTLDKIGAGSLTLTGHNTHALTLIEKGTLKITSDASLGQTGTALTVNGGILHANSSLTTARPIVLGANDGTFEATNGKTLTLSGVISGAGDFLVGPVGNVVVTGQSNTNSGSVAIGSGTGQMVNGVTITAPGTHGTVIVTPGPTPNEVASIDLTNANTPISVTVKSPKTGTVTVDKIVSLDNTAIKAVTLGANVILGDGVADGSPDLEIDGKLTTLTTADVNPNTIIRLGKGLAYTDTYKNNPNVTIHDILGSGVTIDLTGDGVNPGVSGGGGLGKLVVNTWGSPGLIKTTQGIKSYLVKKGDSFASLQVDPTHLGVNTVANVGSISIPTGIWAGTGLQVEGVVAQFLTKGLAVGSTLTAGAFGTVKIKGNFLGSIVAAYDATVTVPVKNKPPKVIATGVVGNVTITSGDFSGLINGDGAVGSILLTGTARFTGTVRGASIGNITAASFIGTGSDGPRHSITATGSIGNITASVGGLTDYLIAAGADLGSDAKLGGVADHFTSFTTSATGVNTAVSIGNVTIKGTVTGTTIEAGVNPGPLGLFGDGDDALVPLPALIKTKAKIGAMKFDALGTAALAFTDTTLKAIGNAFEAQSLLSIQIGKAKVAPTFLNVFTGLHYVDSGASSIIVRLLS